MDGNLKKLFKRLLLMLMVIGSSSQCMFAEDDFDLSNVKFEIICNDEIGLDEKIIDIGYVLTYGDQFNPDDLELKIPGFESDCAKLLCVVKTSNNKNVSFINGKSETTHKTRWTASVKTQKEGNFTTPEVILEYKGERLDISPQYKTISVMNSVRDGEKTKLIEQKNLKEKPSLPEDAIIKLVTSLNKESVSMGDSIIMEVKLISNQEMAYVRTFTPIEIDDCYYKSINFESNKPEEISLNGVECHEWKVFEYVLIPLITGEIKIPEIKITGDCRIRRDEPDPFFGSLAHTYNVPFETQSKALKLKVKN